MKLTLRQIRRSIMVLILLILASVGGYSLGQRKVTIEKGKYLPEVKIERSLPVDKESIDFQLFWDVWDKLQVSYLNRKDLDSKKMVYGAISGMVASLGDPYTVFLPPTENKDAKADLRGDFEGVGIQIGYNKDQQISVIAPIGGTPADKAGIKTGDVILQIIDDVRKIDKKTDGLTLPQAVEFIRGPKGSVVKLLIQREKAEKPLEFSLKRETIVVKSVELKFENKNGKDIAVLKLSRFGERTYEEWQAAVDEIKNKEANNKNSFAGVILDLRNNPGGFLQGSVFIGSEFLSASPAGGSSGVVVQQDRGADGKETYSVVRKGKLLNEPLIVLVNGGSASASEIVAGALQEAKRGRLVGEKTFGKGTVQEAQDLPGGGGLHITVARWLLSSGKSIDKEGVNPDVEVKIDEKNTDQTKDIQLDKAIDLLVI